MQQDTSRSIVMHVCNRNILLGNVPIAVDAPIADIAIFMLMGGIRNLVVGMQLLRGGNWSGETGLSHDLGGTILGILGMDRHWRSSCRTRNDI